jgi:hypothetical protein
MRVEEAADHEIGLARAAMPGAEANPLQANVSIHHGSNGRWPAIVADGRLNIQTPFVLSLFEDVFEGTGFDRLSPNG